jgi:hypothetical protein
MQLYDLRAALRETGLGEMSNADEYIDSIIVVIQNMMFSLDVRKFENFKLINIVSSESGFTFSWVSAYSGRIRPAIA